MLLSLNYIPPPDLTGLVIIPSTAGMSFVWDNPIDSSLWAIEIWEASTNNRASATLLDTVVGTNTYEYISLGTGSITHYFWIRAKGIYGQTNGAWYPISSTAGIAGTSGLSNTPDIATGAVTSTALISSTAPVDISVGDFVLENIFSTTITGEGYPVLTTTSLDVTGTSVIGGASVGAARTILLHSLINTSAGGSDITTSITPYSLGTELTYGTTGSSWVNISNMQSTNDVFATNTIVNPVDKVLLSSFDFTAIPSTATLLNIYVVITAKGSAAFRIGIKLCWDSIDFPSWGGLFMSSEPQALDLTTTNTTSTLGEGDLVEATWGEYENKITGFSRPITMADIRSSDFGVRLYNVNGVNGQIIYIDSVKVACRYSTKEYVVRTPQVVLDSDIIVLAKQVPMVRNASTLVDGNSYNHRLDWCTRVSYPGDAIYPTRSNVLSTIQTFRR